MMTTVAEGAEVYEAGDQVGLAARFGSEELQHDPSRVIFRISDPQGRMAELAYGHDAAVTQTAPGAYQVIVEASIAGRWRYRFVGLDGISRAEHDGFFDVFDLSG